MPTAEEIRSRRRAALEELASLGAFRRGSVVEHYVPGKRRDGSTVRYGPYLLYSSKQKGQKTVSRHLKGLQEAERYREQIARFRRFQQLMGELVRLGELACELEAAGEEPAKKGASQRSRRRRK